jgi:hypothetical protein
MNDFFDSLNDSIKDDAGMLGAMGGLAALNNQRAQVNKLAALQKGQAQAAKTEQHRLQIEKQRLELEEARFAEQKAEMAAIKGLRRIMAEVGSDLDRIESQFCQGK